MPNSVRKLAEKATEFHGLIHRGLDMDNRPSLKPETYLKVITACSGLKETDFFNKVLEVCEADIKGRLGFENKPYPQKKFWQNLASIATNVDNDKILKMGLKGEAIGLEINKRRLNNIKQLLKEINND